MEKRLELIKELLRQHDVTPAELFESFISDGELKLSDLPNDFKINLVASFQGGVIPITEDNLGMITPGMFWYDDDSVSQKLIKSKTVKSVVLLVKDSLLYGDTFVQKEYNNSDGTIFTRKFCSSFVAEGEAQWLSYRDMHEVFNFYEKINPSCRLLGKEVWGKGPYWTSSKKERASYAASYSIQFDGTYSDYDILFVHPVFVKRVDNL